MLCAGVWLHVLPPLLLRFEVLRDVGLRLLGEEVGSGVEVVLVDLLGERSGGGKVEGWERVETIVLFVLAVV